MLLNIPERITLYSALPEQGNIVTMRIVAELKSNLLLSEGDVKEGGVETLPEGRVGWKNNIEKEIPIGEKATDVIVEALKTLDKNGRVTEQHLTLWNKFIKD